MSETGMTDIYPSREITLTKPIAMKETEVTVGEFRQHVAYCESGQISHGRFVLGPDRHIASMLCADSEEAVAKMGMKLQAGQSLLYVSDILQLVPTMKEYEERFAKLEQGGAEFLKSDHPVVNVSQIEAAACASLYFGGRLPTEAEWEFAARAGRKGDKIAGTDTGEVTTENAHWGYSGSVKATVPVKSHAPNPWGLYGMAGNVCEWTQSGDDDGEEGMPPSRDPVGPLETNCAIFRGGSWYKGKNELHAARYYGTYMTSYDEYIGFRVVRSLDSKW